MNASEIIEKSIRFEESMRDSAPASEKHFWDGWTAEAVRAGKPVVSVTVSCPGNGQKAVFVVHLLVKLPGGGYSSTSGTGHVEHVATRSAAWKNGLEGYARRLAAKLHGAELPVEFKHHV
jgi:hypothetical protein